MTVRTHRLPHHPQLGRNIVHDDTSRQYLAETAKIVNVTHDRHTPILNQLKLGKCTCEAAAGLLGTDPFFTTLPADLQTVLDTPGNDADQADGWTSALYHDETELENPDDAYPPNDPGGSGLFVSKVLKARDLIGSYRHAFGLQHALGALTVRPVLIGVPWFNSMFEPGADGILTVDPSSGLAGGHELVMRVIDFTNFDDLLDERNLLFGDNSWSPSWGADGMYGIRAKDFNLLLSMKGDVVAPVPIAA